MRADGSGSEITITVCHSFLNCSVKTHFSLLNNHQHGRVNEHVVVRFPPVELLKAKL